MPVPVLTQAEKRQHAGIRIAVDRGGTFCDVYATFRNKPPVILKVLSRDAAYADAPTEAIRRILEIGYEETIPRGVKLDVSGVETIRMGTTVATNALLERKGERTGFVVTKGFRDLLYIGNQSRPKLFDLSTARPDPLYEDVLEIEERVLLADAFTIPDAPIKEGISGVKIQVEKAPDAEQVRKDLTAFYESGIRSLSVALLHSYTFPEHEMLVGKIALDIGFTHVSLSSQISPMIRILPRAHSATADAYLTPELKRYLNGFEKSFVNIGPGMLQYMQSDGGLVDAATFSGLRAILSGPAGGVVGYARTCYDETDRTPVIGFDMGGTSTDVSRYDGHLDHIMETTTAGVSIQSPQLDICTVAAGGGSILFWENGLLRVGPESAGADPGPACYRKGGPLTVTDANILLGRLVPSFFPNIFGPNENLPLDTEIVTAKFNELASRINADTGGSKSPEEIAMGFLQIACETMCTPIRTLSESRGHETASHNLATFGGAGGQTACDVATALGIRKVLVHKSASVLSAYGIALADVVDESQESFAGTTADYERFNPRLEALREISERNLEGYSTVGDGHVLLPERYLNMRYDGADANLMIPEPTDGDWAAAFKAEHHQQFGFSPTGRAVMVDDLRVRVTSRIGSSAPEAQPSAQIQTALSQQTTPEIGETTKVYFDKVGWVDTALYNTDVLPTGSTLSGPAILVDKTSTIVVQPEAEVLVTDSIYVITVPGRPKVHADEGVIDPVQLSIFGHRFMSISEQMGHSLQKTAVSVNIKERVDYSCALFDPEGRLVANAPHVPAMLGSMQFAVIWQAEHWRGKLKAGDVLVANHPISGGTHLPDITIVTPVFDAEGRNIIFWTAARGHHADIGGITPGSMPATARSINDEGAAIVTHKIVSDGVFDEEGITRLLVDEPAKHNHGTRNLADNISDLKAQIAACNKGVNLVQELVKQYSLPIVQMYMRAIQETAATAVRDLLKTYRRKNEGKPLVAVDHMDDGTPICLRVDIDRDTGNAVFDWDGTGPEVYGPSNAPPATCNSATIYALRCMLGSEIPLNHGCLEPITLKLPEGSILKPSFDAAVAGGNGTTTQRITDVVLKAFQACGASHGCVNNFTFGYDDPDGKSWGFYETLGGGVGAGPTWEGRSGSHTHMSNTRITDIEVMERRCPVIIRRYHLRPNSGGAGQHRGGDGLVREYQFRRALTAGMLSERRVFSPYGMAGGEDAKPGLNLWVTKTSQGATRTVNFGSKNTVQVNANDRIVILTAGGGGWGPVGKAPAVDLKHKQASTFVANGGPTARREMQHTN